MPILYRACGRLSIRPRCAGSSGRIRLPQKRQTMQLHLDSFGAALSVQNGLFRVRTRAGTEQALAVRDVQAILLTRGVSLSTDALALALANDIPVILLDDAGHPAGHFWSGQYGSIGAIRKRQALWCGHPQGLQWACGVLARKTANQRALLQALARAQPDNRDLERSLGKGLPAINFIAAQLRDWVYREPEGHKAALDTLRGWEGVAARHYWRAVSTALPGRWRFAERSTHPARDAFNALLNYGYGVLYAQVEVALLKAGLDPSMGVLHADQHRRPTLVFDCIEAYRVWVDEVAVALAQSGVLTENAFRTFDDGSVWLEAPAKSPLLDALLAALERPPSGDGRQVMRRTLIDLDAQKLASSLKRFRP